MSDGIDIDFLKDSYARMSDDEITRICVNDGNGLTEAAQKLLKEEINKRGLNSNLIKGVAAQQKKYSDFELLQCCEILRKLPSPTTVLTNEKLNGSLVMVTKSYLFIIQRKKEIIIDSPTQLDKANNQALLTSCLLGWWEIPKGIAYTIQSINQNIKSKKTNHDFEPNLYLLDFVRTNIGIIETYKNDTEKLKQLITY